MSIYVESLNDLQEYQSTITHGTCFFHFIYNEKIHPSKTSPIVLFVHHFDTHETYVFSFSHPDIICINPDILQIVLNVPCKKLIFDKKNARHFANLDNFIDIKFDNYAKTLNELYVKLPNVTDIRSCPIMIIKKSFNDTLELLKNKIEDADIEQCEFEDDFSKQLYMIESSGIHVDRSTFNLADHAVIDEQDCVHSQYNMLTPTYRPSNRFAKINFAALNKKKNERDCICSRHDGGAIVMIDYESYHLRLFGTHVGFDLPKTSLHEYLGCLYHDKDTLTEEEYELSKKITFNIMYGGVSDDIKENIPFMNQIALYVEKLWSEYNSLGYVKTWFYKQKLRKSTYGELNPYKLFNYVLQNAETERNCLMMKKINEEIKSTDIKFILYHYDAFIFDMKVSDFHYVENIKNSLIDDGMYPVKIYAGGNYGDLKLINV